MSMIDSGKELLPSLQPAPAVDEDPHRMWRLVRRVIIFILTLATTFLGLTAVTFCIGRFIPVDPVLAIVGDHASHETYEATRLAIGLDRPIPVQYLIYLRKVLGGDFGESVMTSKPVLDDLFAFFPATIELSTVGILFGVLIGVPAGVIAGAKRDRWPDQLVRVVSLFGYSTPVFWLGLVALFVFYGKLDWVVGTGRLDVAYDDIVTPHTGFLLIDAALEGEWEVWHNALSHLVLPGALLAYYSLAYIARMTRSFMIEQLSQEYVIAARVKGRSYWGAVWRHAFPNIMVPLITVIGLSYASLLEGSVLTETVFAWPGLGLYITRSLFNADMNAVLGGTLAVGTAYIGVNAICDALYKIFDPRLNAS
jgi:peptide/nickel transport system permease protein